MLRQFLLDMTDGQPLIAYPNEGSVNAQACRIAERLELPCHFFDFHGNRNSSKQLECQSLFPQLWNLTSHPAGFYRNHLPRLKSLGRAKHLEGLAAERFGDRVKAALDRFRLSIPREDEFSEFQYRWV